MKPESVVFGVTGMVFGLIVGWLIGTQQAPSLHAGAAAVPAPSTAAAVPAARPVVDETQAQALRTIAERDPRNAASRVQLGNLYFDGERYADAIKYYDEALKLEPRDVNVSTDLAVSYYYTGQIDRALTQFDYSLSIDAKHLKTILNQGIVRAFGKQDLNGAAAAWERVLTLAPDSPEGVSARRALDNLKAAHPGGAAVPPPGTPPAGATMPVPGRIGG